MKSFVCLLEKYWVGSKVLVLFSYKIICHFCHCWIYCVVCLWLTTIIHRVYAFLHCSPIVCQMSKEGNIKNQKVPGFCSCFVSSSSGPEKEPDALRNSLSKHKSAPQPLAVTETIPKVWFRAMDRGPEAGISGRQHGRQLLEVWKPAESLPKWSGSGGSS